MRVSKMLTDAREVLVDAHKVQKCKIWVKGFQTHNLSYILDENSLSYANLKIHKISSFFIIFASFRQEIFDFLQKCKNTCKINSTYFNEFLSNIHAKLCVGKLLTHILHFCTFWASASISRASADTYMWLMNMLFFMLFSLLSYKNARACSRNARRCSQVA